MDEVERTKREEGRSEGEEKERRRGKIERSVCPTGGILMEAEAGGGAGLGEDRVVAQMGGERECVCES